MHRELRTVCNSDGIAVLEIVREGENVTIYEADDMDRHISFPATVLTAFADYLTSLQQGAPK